jgi:hypothetical protein
MSRQNTSSGSQPAPAASLTEIRITRADPKPAAPTAAPCHGTTDAQVTILEPARAQAPVPINDDAPDRPEAFPSALPAIATDDTPPCDAPVAPAAIIDLWEHLAKNRLRPKISDLDPLMVARRWPNSLLLRVSDTARRPALEVAHMFAPTAGGPTVAIPIDAMTVDWIVALGREVVSTGSPVHETDAVPTNHGATQCGVIGLPFGPEAGVDHVLCHLYRTDEHLIEGDAMQTFRLPPRDRTGIRRLFGR